MNEFIKKMLQLGAELEKTESPMQASMIINDAEILYRDEIKSLTIPVVVSTSNCEHVRGGLILRNNEWFIECRKCGELY
tara:strand:+ start:94 stop:330 length:237 start_codon:yes stop_codon:yes gene_type:complete